MPDPMHGPVGLADSTPRDGDFVAYLAAIERQQLRHLRAAAQATAAATAATTEAHRAERSERGERDDLATRVRATKARGQGSSVDGRRFAGAMLMGFVAIILIAAGLGQGGAWPALAIGGVLAWQAWVQGRRALAM
jgi:hypothetical protein